MLATLESLSAINAVNAETVIAITEETGRSWIGHVGLFFLDAFVLLLQALFWLVVFLLLIVWSYQGHLLYMNNMSMHTGDRRQLKYNEASMRTPAALGLPFEEQFLRTKDGIMIHTWLITQDTKEATKTAPTLVYFHGNAGSKLIYIPFISPNFVRLKHSSM